MTLVLATWSKGELHGVDSSETWSDVSNGSGKGESFVYKFNMSLVMLSQL